MKKKLSVILCAALVLSALCAALLTACNDKPNEPAVYTLDPDRDFGLYWYNDKGEKMLSEADMPVEFYDPEKPTVVYSHGWKMNPVPEALVTQQSTVESTGGLSGERNYAAQSRGLQRRLLRLAPLCRRPDLPRRRDMDGRDRNSRQ